MSIKSQENNLRRLTQLLSQDLSYIWGERESGPNGAKKVFLNTGKGFLRVLAQDLRLREAKVSANAAGIACSGECYLMGMWETGGIYICLEQACYGDNVLLYRTIRNLRDYAGGRNQHVRLSELRSMSYAQLVERLSALRGEVAHERAA